MRTHISTAVGEKYLCVACFEISPRQKNLYKTYKHLYKTYKNLYKTYKDLYKTYNNLYKTYKNARPGCAVALPCYVALILATQAHIWETEACTRSSPADTRNKALNGVDSVPGMKKHRKT